MEPEAAPRRKRVLLIAELCNPVWISVPQVGFRQWRALAEVADVHLVTHQRNRENLEAAGLAGERVTTLDTAAVDAPLLRLAEAIAGGDKALTARTALSILPYYLFEHLLWERFGASIRGHRWDVVHRVTPLSPALPSLVAAKCRAAGVPFVLGPLNGGVPWPKGFAAERLREREHLSYLRSGFKLLPGYRATRENAAAILVASRSSYADLPARWRPKTTYIPENAIDIERFSLRARDIDRPLRVAFVGRFSRIKGIDLLVEAAAPLVKAGQVVLDLIGDGDQMPELRGLARREGLGEAMFAGWVPHGELAERLARSHVLGFPSWREFGGAAVLEAMALGLVPIVMDHGGPAELVSPRTGFAVPLGTRAEIVARLRELLARLAQSPELLAPMSVAARERVRKRFTWSVKAEQFVEVHRWVCGERDKPDFGMPFPD